ncbi:hypothetical protein CDAR_496191 [Caerostris darwini]|uniref:Uncharacterized protein n=1 Tax=Caerostris darwini TaxID=1538125 RepID=A0AAV4U1Y5_9ARAC|nr:hypothetical protein CDAR_496191 [Caerostris darwini]
MAASILHFVDYNAVTRGHSPLRMAGSVQPRKSCFIATAMWNEHSQPTEDSDTSRGKRGFSCHTDMSPWAQTRNRVSKQGSLFI